MNAQVDGNPQKRWRGRGLGQLVGRSVGLLEVVVVYDQSQRIKKDCILVIQRRG
jgi:hypothetical protein